jgi:hypothetical protein
VSEIEVVAVDVDLAAIAEAVEEVEAIALKGALGLDLKEKDDVAIVSLLAGLLDDLLILNQREAIFQDQEKAVDSQLDC